MEKIKITISGRDYYIRSEDDGERVKTLAKELEASIDRLKKVMRGRSETEVVTLAALDRFDDADKARAELSGTSELLSQERAKYEVICSELLSSTDALEKAKNEIIERDEALGAKQKELENAVASYNEARREEEENLKKFDKALKRLSNENEALKQTAQSASAAAPQAEDGEMIKKLKADVEKYRNISLEKEAELAQTAMDCEATVNALNDGLKRAKSEIEQLRSQLKNGDSAANDGELSEKLKAAQAEIEALKKSSSTHVLMLNEGIESAQAEMMQLANVKDEENKQLRAKLVEYEKAFEGFVDDHDKELKTLKGQYEAVKKELEKYKQAAASGGDSGSKMKDIEIRALLESNTKLRRENEELNAKVSSLEDGQITIC